MDFVVLLGRILFGTLAISSAVSGHFANTDGLAGYAQAQPVRPVSGRS